MESYVYYFLSYPQTEKDAAKSLSNIGKTSPIELEYL